MFNLESDIEAVIVHYLQETITEDEMHQLEAWVNRSKENKDLFYSVKDVADLCRNSQLLQQNNTEENWNQIKGLIEERLRSKQTFQLKARRIVLTSLKYAAVAAIAVAIGLYFTRNRTKAPEKTLAAVTYNEVRVERGGHPNTMFLSDGTKVILNAASSLRYPSNFNGKERKVYLEGEAYFEVAHNARKPFKVMIKNEDVTVLGTTFNVEAYPDESLSKVTLLTGSIALNTYYNKQQSKHIVLKPNQKATTDKQNGNVSVININDSSDEAWTQGVYRFHDEQLATIINRLEKYYGVNIHLNSGKIGLEKYTGSFALSQDLGSVLQVINFDRQYKISRTQNDIYITTNNNR